MREIGEASSANVQNRLALLSDHENQTSISREYAEFVTELKARIQSARIFAARAVNRDLILLYWDIGRGIVEKQEELGWDESVVELLSRDLQQAFPG